MNAPGGLVYEPELVTAEEERDALALMDELEFHEIRMQGQVAKRRVAQFGLRYEFGTWKLAEEPFGRGIRLTSRFCPGAPVPWL